MLSLFAVLSGVVGSLLFCGCLTVTSYSYFRGVLSFLRCPPVFLGFLSALGVLCFVYVVDKFVGFH